MSYVIVRDTDGKFVSKPGMIHSYTDKVREVQIFSSREEAEKQLCYTNEHVEELS